MNIYIYDHEGSVDQAGQPRRPHTEALKTLFESLQLCSESAITIDSLQDINRYPALLIAHCDFTKTNIATLSNLAKGNETSLFILLVSSSPPGFDKTNDLPVNIRWSRIPYSAITADLVIDALERCLKDGRWPDDSKLFGEPRMDAAIALYLLFAAGAQPTFASKPQLFVQAYVEINAHLGKPISGVNEVSQQAIGEALSTVFAKAIRD